MNKTKKTINNHFIQKAFAKNFSKNGILKWTNYKPNTQILTEQTFNVNEQNVATHPIVKQYFYSQDIEDGMNEIESEGIKVIQEIAFKANNNVDDKVVLNRKQLYALKFYFLLSSTRTNGIRNNILKLNGDFLFNSIMEKDGRKEKDIQQDMIQMIIDEYKRNKRNEELSSRKWNEDYFQEKFMEKDLSKLSFDDFSVEKIMFVRINEAINSRLIIFKFKKNKLFLQESIAFNEGTSYGGIMYNFMAISPNVGAMFYVDYMNSRGLIKLENSQFFNNKINEVQHNIKYVNQNKMEELLLKNKIEITKKIPNISEAEMMRILSPKIIDECCHHNDQYIYKVLTESEEVQDICNAMALVHNDNGVLIYQDKNDIKDAEFQIRKLNISRIEDKRR